MPITHIYVCPFRLPQQTLMCDIAMIPQRGHFSHGCPASPLLQLPIILFLVASLSLPLLNRVLVVCARACVLSICVVVSPQATRWGIVRETMAGGGGLNKTSPKRSSIFATLMYRVGIFCGKPICAISWNVLFQITFSKRCIEHPKQIYFSCPLNFGAWDFSGF